MRRSYAVMSVLGAAAVLAAAFASGSGASSSAAPPSAVRTERATAPRLVWGVLSRGASIDPAVGDQSLAALALEPLMKITSTGKLEGLLARKVTQPGRTVYVYHLRRGVRFSDGRELTAEDVTNAINYQRFPGKITASWYASVRDVKAIDRYRVRVSLKRRDASWPYVAAAQGFVFQKKFQDEHKLTMGRPGTLIVGTGPYKFDSYDPTRGAELSPNPHYWGGKPQIQRISVRFFSDEQGLALAFRSGGVDVAFPGDPRAFRATSGATLLSVPGCGPGFLTMNTRRPPFNDIHVRRAVAAVINRGDIIKAAGGYATPIHTYIAPTHLQSIATTRKIDALMRSLPNRQRNLARAKQEMARSAYPNGVNTYMQVYTSTFPGLKNLVSIGQVVVAQLKEIGINAELRAVPIGEFSRAAAETDPQSKIPLSAFEFYCQVPDPSLNLKFAFYGKFVSRAWANFPHYVNPTVDGLIDQAAAVTGPAKRFTAYSRLLRTLAADVPVLPLYASNVTVALSRKFTWPTFNLFVVPNKPWILEVKPR